MTGFPTNGVKKLEWVSEIKIRQKNPPTKATIMFLYDFSPQRRKGRK